MRDYPQRIRPRLKRPSFPTVISLIALFVALGGTSYAVIKLPAASVGNRELKRNAVTASKIRNGSVGSAELASDAAGRRGPRGLQGPAGPTGASGAVGDLAPWQPLPFAGTWTNYSSGFSTAAFRKDQLGKVHLRGLVTKNGGLPTLYDQIAVLPPGFRPPATVIFAVAAGGPNELYGRIDVEADGDVMLRAGGTTEVDFESLDTISFWTDG